MNPATTPLAQSPYRMNDIQYIMNMLLDEYDFDRMLNHDMAGSFQNYADFLSYNERIIRELPADDLAVLRRLCGMIKTSVVNLMDLESCVEFQSGGIYYNSNGQLCIYNPR